MKVCVHLFSGVCFQGEQCSFAHSSLELTQMQIPRSSSWLSSLMMTLRSQAHEGVDGVRVGWLGRGLASPCPFLGAPAGSPGQVKYAGAGGRGAWHPPPFSWVPCWVFQLLRRLCSWVALTPSSAWPRSMVAGLATCGCRPLPHMHDAYFFLYVTGRSFVLLGMAKCLAVRLGQVVGVVVAARGFFSFLFSYFRAMGVFFSFFFCFLWAAREYSNFLFCYFQFAGGGLCVLYRARGLASPGPHVGARPGVRVSRVFLVVPRLESHVSWGCLLVSLCPSDRLSHEVCTTLYVDFVGTVSSDLACLVSVAVSLLWWLVLRLCVLVPRLGSLWLLSCLPCFGARLVSLPWWLA